MFPAALRYSIKYQLLQNTGKGEYIRLKLLSTQGTLHHKLENQNEEFLENGHKRHQSFSLILMSDVTKFCNKTINKVSQEFKKRKHVKLRTNDRNDIFLTLEKNDELNRKHQQQRRRNCTKNKVFH